ncbi:CKK domain-containing protein [Plasmodiophora brassicae]|uniref:CKK domain-containing protein n=1 Tax=Plasmodiophora brassicae TaxID=37360 RepID=A0A0G4IQW9_PLABS|nr:hypothetical protein PBRA_005862 [Plasmodiophora brassicae]SPQ98295.1 unnamed protein product [Plasmodiophora brassicae]
MSTSRRRMRVPRVRDWRTQRPQTAPAPPVAGFDEILDDRGVQSSNGVRVDDDSVPPPIMSMSPCYLRRKIPSLVVPRVTPPSSTSLLLEAGHTSRPTARRYNREVRSFDSIVVSNDVAAPTGPFWSAMPGAVIAPIRCDSPPHLPSPRVLLTPDMATVTVVEGAEKDDQDDDKTVFRSVTCMDPPGAPVVNASIQIFPRGTTAPAMVTVPGAADRFLLEQQVRRISMHRTKAQQERDAVLADHKRDVVKMVLSRDEGEPTDEVTQSEPVIDASDEGQVGAKERVKKGGVSLNISLSDDGESEKALRQRKMLSGRRRPLSKVRARPSPLPRPDSRMLPRSNRSIMRNALSRVCLAGGATELERMQALDALEQSPSDWFLVLLRKERHKFRGLYQVDACNDGDVSLTRIYGDGPIHINGDTLDGVFKYDSANKCFEQLASRQLTATTDAVSIASKKFGSV